jgi:hypothetical protein
MESVYTRWSSEKFSSKLFKAWKTTLEDHFASEYVKVTGCQPDRVIIQSLANNFWKLWQILRKKDNVLTSPRGQAFLSVKLPVPVAEKEKEKEMEKETEKETERKKER